MSRRTTITETPPGGGSAVTSLHLWCGARLCQTRNSGNVVIRTYHAEGEFVPGSPGQAYYYGVDQIGSVRRAFTSPTAPAYAFDAYGNAVGSATRVTDFGFAGMFYHADSGLHLTQYRAYDPNTGRWLSRDPVGEDSDPAGNLYPYVGGNPVSQIDPDGRFVGVLPAIAGGLGGIGGGLLGGSLLCAINPGLCNPLPLLGALCKLSGMCSPAEPPCNDDTKPGGADNGSKPLPPRPDGIPPDWLTQPTRDEDGTEYINPKNKNDRVRVMSGNPNSPYPHQQGPYVKDQNGGFRDVNGNPITDTSKPGNTPEAHIPYDQFQFRR